MVDRYTACLEYDGNGEVEPGMEPYPDGGWVGIGDYDALAARLADTEAVLASLQARWDNRPTQEKLEQRVIDAERERDALRYAVNRWKIEEMRQLQCQCAHPRAFDLGDVPWCEACEKPREWKDVVTHLRPDERALLASTTGHTGFGSTSSSASGAKK